MNNVAIGALQAATSANMPRESQIAKEATRRKPDTTARTARGRLRQKARLAPAQPGVDTRSAG